MMKSLLYGQINQHTNPTGILKDTVIQKLYEFLSDGALRDLSRYKNAEEKHHNN